MVFTHILAKCRAAGGRIMSIHSRRASGAVLEYLEKYSEAGTPVLHGFSGSLPDLERATRLGCWFSVGPAMLKTENGRRLAVRMPRERVLTESDGPFAQLDDTAIMPWQIGHAIGALSRMWSLPEEEVEKVISDNLQALLARHNDQAFFSIPHQT